MSIPTHSTYTAFADTDGLDADGLDGASANRLEEIAAGVYRSAPFRTGYFTVVLIQSGRGRYWVDGAEYPTAARTVYVTLPGHVKAFAFDEPTTGRVLTFTEAFLKQTTYAAVFDDLPFLLAQTSPPFDADPATFDGLDALAAQIEAEVGRPSSVQPRLVGALLLALLLRLRGAFWDGDGPAATGDRGAALVEGFRRDLEASLRALVAGEAVAPPSVADLAAAQAVHPNYLSTVVKAQTGRTVGDWTAEKLAAEARGLLTDPRASVKDIAYRLGFSEPTAFARFFKRETGQTPSAFRSVERSA